MSARRKIRIWGEGVERIGAVEKMDDSYRKKPRLWGFAGREENK